MSRFRSPVRPPLVVGVFAVEDTCIQVFWRHADRGEITVSVGDKAETIQTDGGPGTLDVDGLEPQTRYQVAIGGGGLDHRQVITTASSPPGDELIRIGTLNDLHLGCDYFGYLTTIREHPKPDVVSSVRCSRVAVEQMRSWGMEHMILKGDVVHRGNRKEWDSAADLVTRAQVPTDLLLGNHEVGKYKNRLDPVAEAAAFGCDVEPAVRVRDLPGIRLVMADTPIPRKHHGRVAPLIPEIADAVADADGPVMVVLHHNLMALPFPTFLPRGISSREGTPLLRAIRAANPSTLVTSGHTHRHRCRWHDGMPVVEVGSPKDYPGTWCGYVVHEGGVRQVVRRVDGADTLPWNERCARAALGAWSWWSPGTLDDRCFTHAWPTSAQRRAGGQAAT